MQSESVVAIVRSIVSQFGVSVGLTVVVGAALVALGGIVARQYLARWATSSVEKQLEKHKSELHAETERLRSDLQRRLLSLSKYDDARHQAYATTFKALLRAEGAFSKLVGYRLSTDWQVLSRSEIEPYLLRQGLAAPLVERLLARWEDDTEGCIKQIREALRNNDITRALGLQQRFINRLLAEALYFSPAVSTSLLDANQKLSAFSAEFLVRHEEPMRQLKKRDEMQIAVARVQAAMQRELSSGPEDGG